MVNALGRATRAAVHRGNIRSAWGAPLDALSPWVLLRDSPRAAEARCA